MNYNVDDIVYLDGSVSRRRFKITSIDQRENFYGVSMIDPPDGTWEHDKAFRIHCSRVRGLAIILDIRRDVAARKLKRRKVKRVR